MWLDGGDFSIFGSAQEASMSEFIAQAMERLGYSAVGFGFQELTTEFGPFEKVLARAALPFVSANLRFLDTNERVFPAYRIISVPLAGEEARSLRIGVIGITSPHDEVVAFGPSGRSIATTSPSSELAALLPEVRTGSDLIVVISSGGSWSQQNILEKDPDIDLLLISAERDVWRQAKKFGRAMVYFSGDRGREVLRVAILPPRESDRFAYRFENIHLGEKTAPEDPETRQTVEEQVTRLNEESRALMKAAAVSSPPRDISPYVGSIKCGECHAREREVWMASRHAHAFEALVQAKRDYTTTCAGCHVTGSGGQGGFADPASTPQLLDVQCEACHEAGGDHVRDPAASYGAVETPNRCKVCHDDENSPSFDYATYWPRIAH